MIKQVVQIIREWAQAHVYILHLFSGMIERVEAVERRIEALEAAYHNGQMVYTIYVPDGMSPEIAWRHVREGRAFEPTGQKTFILADWKGDLLKVLS